MAVISPGRVVLELIDAFSATDWPRFEATLAPDVVYSETGTGRQVEGAEAYIELCKGWKQAFPDAVGDPGRTAVDGDSAIQEVMWRGTHTGPLEMPSGNLDPTGHHIDAPGCLWCRVAGDRVTDIRHYLDVLAILQQVGALSPG
jgi:steroid delta-isomerase-like uncharacterized protein